jgi:hypothetical protein
MKDINNVLGTNAALILHTLSAVYPGENCNSAIKEAAEAPYHS